MQWNDSVDQAQLQSVLLQWQRARSRKMESHINIEEMP